MILFIMFIIIVFTSKYRLLAIAAKSLSVGMITFLLSDWFLSIACQNKFLPWSYCGDFTGIINIFLTMSIISIVSIIITSFILVKKT